MSDWVVVELSVKAEGEDPEVLARSISRLMRVVSPEDIYVPASITQVGEDRVVQYLVDGYAFIRRIAPDTAYFKLEGSRYVHSVLTTRSLVPGVRRTRTLSCVTDADINRMRGQIQVEVDQGIGVGDTVLITSGAYKNIQATVIEDVAEADKVQVFIRLRSKEALVSLPRSFLQLVSKLAKPATYEALDKVKSWLDRAKVVASWPRQSLDAIRRRWSDLRLLDTLLHQVQQMRVLVDTSLDQRRLQEPLQTYGRLVGLSASLLDLSAAIAPTTRRLDKDSLVEVWHRLTRMQGWIATWAQLAPIVRASYRDPRDENWGYSLGRFHDLDAWAGRLGVIQRDVARMEAQMSMTKGSTSGIQHVLVDGHNLAFRCLYAPGLGTLTNSQGQPTGMILAFLNSLVSYRKKFPSALITVCWDGSSQRRKKKFAGYKATRPAHSGQPNSQVEWLRTTLPLFGVTQAYNPDEEADDVIATLISGDYANAHNVIVSTDKDLLQLVSHTNLVLSPAQGAGKETLYDTDVVVEKYGVSPQKMVALRAFLGDTSDNIPGVPRIPSKVINNLLRMYESVDKVFDSGLAELTRLQYEKLRAAETQVKLNVELMSLHHDLAVTWQASNPDQIAAEQRLREMQIKPGRIVEMLLGATKASGFSKTG